MVHTIVLLGHSLAGATPLGHALARALGVPFHPALARDPEARDGVPVLWHIPPDATPDDRIFRAERTRDARAHRQLRVVESWHPGNLARCEHRSRHRLQPHLFALIRSGVTSDPGVLVLPLRIGENAASGREGTAPASLRADIDDALVEAAVAWAIACGWTVAEPIDTAALAPDALVEHAAAAVIRTGAGQRAILA